MFRDPIGAVQKFLLSLLGRRNTRATDFYRRQLHQLIGVVENRVDNDIASGKHQLPDEAEIIVHRTETDDFVERLAGHIETVLGGHVDYDSFSAAIRRYGIGE